MHGRLIPAVPVRQWVLSLPFWLRYRVAHDHRLFSEMVAVWTKTVTNFYRKRAREQHDVDDGLCAAVSGIQHVARHEIRASRRLPRHN